MGFSRNKLYPPPVEDIDFFEVDPPEFPVILTPWNFPFFCIDPPWKSMFFPQFLVYPPGIPTNFTLPLEFFIDIPNRGVTFFSGKAHSVLSSLSLCVISTFP